MAIPKFGRYLKSITFVSRNAFGVAQIEVGEEIEADHGFDVADGYKVFGDGAVVALMVGYEIGLPVGFGCAGFPDDDLEEHGSDGDVFSNDIVVGRDQR